MEKKEEFKYGVGKEKIQQRIYKHLDTIDVEYPENENPIILVYLLETRLVELKTLEANLSKDPEKAEELAKVQEEKAEVEEELKTLKDSDYVRSVDVIDEVEALLANANPKYSFVEIEDVETQIEYYKRLLDGLGKDNLLKRKSELEEEIEKLRTELERLKEQLNKGGKQNPEVGEEYLNAARERAISDLESRIANRKAMIAGRGDELHPNRFEELEKWEKELAELKAGKITPEMIEEARQAEIKDLESKIANREAMIAGRGDELHPNRFTELEEWKKRLNSLQNPEQVQENPEELQEKITEMERTIAEKEKQLKEIEEELANYNEVDTEVKRRIYEHRLKELEEIAKEKQLYKINEKGEVEIHYPPIKPVIDEEAVLAEFAMRRTDMLDKYYGNRDKAEAYAERMDVFRSHIEDKEFEFIDENGNVQVGTYETVIPYEGMEDDLTFLQLEEYCERLERVSKAEAGDVHAYDGMKDPVAARAEDEHYLDTFNNAYNRLESTHKNLKTLGKYGEKVAYNQMQEGQPVRNIFRAVGNVGKFLRNNITAPINKFVGSKIVAPIYGRVTDPNQNVAGLYSNKFSHRYVARRDYFQEQGDGYFKSRIKAVFSAREGNKAVLSAGSHDIKQSLLKKYTDLAEQEARRKQIEFAEKDIDGQIEMIMQDMEKAQDQESKAKLEQTLSDLKKAKEQIDRDRKANEDRKISQTRQTDAVDLDQHDIANKENVTRVVTGVKMAGRLAFTTLIGPKLKDWLIERTMVKKTELVPQQVLKETEQWVPTTYKDVKEPIYDYVVPEDATLQDLIQAKAGTENTGFYSVSGGDNRPSLYEMVGNEKVTAVHLDNGTKWGTGFSDRAGLNAPVLTDKTFPAEFLDSSGVLRQDLKVQELLDLFNETGIKPEELSFSIGDRYWLKGDDLLELVKKQVGETTKTVVDVPGHMEKVTKMVTEMVEKTTMVPNTRVVEVLNKMGYAVKISNGALLAEDIYENVRTTDTEVDPTKPQPREFDFDEVGFTGKKSEDYKAARRRGTEEEEPEL